MCISVVRKTSPNIFELFRYACNRAWLVIPTKPQQSIVLQSCEGGNDTSGCLAANECELINSSEYAARSAAFVLEVINHFWECRAKRPRMSFETTNGPAMSLYFLLKVTSRSPRSNTGAGYGVLAVGDFVAAVSAALACSLADFFCKREISLSRLRFWA